jgi:hypothetical protein
VSFENVLKKREAAEPIIYCVVIHSSTLTESMCEIYTAQIESRIRNFHFRAGSCVLYACRLPPDLIKVQTNNLSEIHDSENKSRLLSIEIADSAPQHENEIIE